MAIFFSDKAKNASIAIAMVSIFNEVRGRKRLPKGIPYVVTIPVIELIY